MVTMTERLARSFQESETLTATGILTCINEDWYADVLALSSSGCCGNEPQVTRPISGPGERSGSIPSVADMAVLYLARSHTDWSFPPYEFARKGDCRELRFVLLVQSGQWTLAITTMCGKLNDGNMPAADRARLGALLSWAELRNPRENALVTIFSGN